MKLVTAVVLASFNADQIPTINALSLRFEKPATFVSYQPACYKPADSATLFAETYTDTNLRFANAVYDILARGGSCFLSVVDLRQDDFLTCNTTPTEYCGRIPIFTERGPAYTFMPFRKF